MNRTLRRPALIAGMLALLVASLVLSACGSHDSSSTTSSSAASIDRAFATEMIDHHQMAIDMAKVAQDRATKPQVKALAASIIAAQQQEIDQLKTVDKQLAEKGVKPGNLGLSDSMMGMNMDDSMLMSAKPFERMFIDMMIPHHQGAIRMARIQIAKGENPQLRKLSQAVIAAQSKEIQDMNAWRMDWYGKESPAGGVPAADEQMNQQMDMPMDHSGM